MSDNDSYMPPVRISFSNAFSILITQTTVPDRTLVGKWIVCLKHGALPLHAVYGIRFRVESFRAAAPCAAV